VDKKYNVLLLFSSGTDIDLFKSFLQFNSIKNVQYSIFDLSNFNLLFPKGNNYYAANHPKVKYYEYIHPNMDLQIIINLFKKIRPNVILTISDHSMVERGLLKLGHFFGTKNAVILNGVVSKGDLEHNKSFLLNRLKTISWTYLKQIFYKYRLLYQVIGLLETKLKLLIIKDLFVDMLKSYTKLDSRGKYDSDVIFTWGKFDTYFLEKRVKFGLKLLPVGNIRLDLEQPLPKLNHENMTNSILLITSAHVEHGLWDVKMKTNFLNDIISSVLSTDSQTKLYIRPHPKEDLNFLHKIISTYHTNRILLTTKNSLLEDISNHETIMMSSSTVILDVFFQKKRLILLDFFNYGNYFLNSADLIAPIYNKQGLLKILKDIKSNQFNVSDDILERRKKLALGYVRNYETRDAVKLILDHLL